MNVKILLGMGFLVVLMFLFGGILFLGNNEPELSPEVVVLPEIIEEDLLSYENVRFKSKNISYSLSLNCTSKKTNEIDQAFSILQGETTLNFNKVFSGGNIEVNCFQETTRNIDEPHVVGTGGPIELINTKDYNIVLKGNVNLYGDEVCETPIYAMHEILHTLGFSHSVNNKSVMYELLLCDQIITNEIIDEISLLYKDPELPNLVIDELTYEKVGRKLDIKVVVLNSGLKNSENVNLIVYYEKNKLVDFELGEFEVGTAKVITFEDLKVSNNEKDFVAILDEDNVIPELKESDNTYTFTA